MTQQGSWSTTTIGEIGNEINKEEISSIICTICEEPATKDTITSYSFCTECPEETDVRIYYCGDCLIMCEKKHKRRGHDPKLEYLSITNVQTMLDHSSKLLVEYGKYQHQKELDMLSKATGTLSKIGKNMISVLHLGFEGFIQYQSVFVAAGSKTAIKFTSKMGMNMSKQILKNTLHGAAGVQAIMCAMEIGTTCALWFSGAISGKELIRRCGKSVISNTAAFGGAYLGFKVGAAVGTFFGPGIGTVVGGIIGSVVGSIGGGLLGEEIFEKYFPEEKKLDPEKELKLALQWFHLEKKDMKDPNKWNEKYITKVYRQLAKIHHPDKNKGEAGKFIATTKHFGILLGELDRKNKGNKENREKRMKEITF